MENYEAIIRKQAAYATRLRDEADRVRAVQGGAIARPAPKAALATLLRRAAERLDPGPRAPRPRSA